MSDADRSRLADALKRAFVAASEASRPAAPAPAERPATAEPRASGSMSFTLPLLRAVLAGRKTQTRRPVRPVPTRVVDGVPTNDAGMPIAPPAVAGERLWVREKWGRVVKGGTEGGVERFAYAVDEPAARVRWMASRFMPRAAARHALAVTGVRLARLSDINNADALREGVDGADGATPREAFITLWDSIYGETTFAAANDPWVWAIDFHLDGAP